MQLGEWGSGEDQGGYGGMIRIYCMKLFHSDNFILTAWWIQTSPNCDQTKKTIMNGHLNCDGSIIIPGKIRAYRSSTSPSFLLAMKMLDMKAWDEYVVEWASKDPYGFITTVILALIALFLACTVLSWNLPNIIETIEKEHNEKPTSREHCKS